MKSCESGSGLWQNTNSDARKNVKPNPAHEKMQIRIRIKRNFRSGSSCKKANPKSVDPDSVFGKNMYLGHEESILKVENLCNDHNFKLDVKFVYYYLISYTYTTCFIYYRKYILQITQPSRTRFTQLQYRFAVISEAPSRNVGSEPVLNCWSGGRNPAPTGSTTLGSRRSRVKLGHRECFWIKIKSSPAVPCRHQHIPLITIILPPFYTILYLTIQSVMSP